MFSFRARAEKGIARHIDASSVGTWLGLFERWITLSTGQIAIQRIVWFVLSTLIHWIAIYPVDSVIQTLNNRGW